jgi:hypothetical protein
MYDDRQLFACYFLRRFHTSSPIPSFLTSYHTKLSRCLSRSGKALHAFVLLSDVHQRSDETLTSRRFARAGMPLMVRMLVTRRASRACEGSLRTNL